MKRGKLEGKIKTSPIKNLVKMKQKNYGKTTASFLYHKSRQNETGQRRSYCLSSLELSKARHCTVVHLFDIEVLLKKSGHPIPFSSTSASLIYCLYCSQENKDTLLCTFVTIHLASRQLNRNIVQICHKSVKMLTVKLLLQLHFKRPSSTWQFFAALF